MPEGYVFFQIIKIWYYGTLNITHFGPKSSIAFCYSIQNTNIVCIMNNIRNDIIIIRYIVSSFLFALYFPAAGFRKLPLEFLSSPCTAESNLQSHARVKM